MNIRMSVALCVSIVTFMRADMPYTSARQALSIGIKRFDLKLTMIALETLEKAGQRVPLVAVLSELDEAIKGHQWWTNWGWRKAIGTCMGAAAAGLSLSFMRDLGVGLGLFGESNNARDGAPQVQEVGANARQEVQRGVGSWDSDVQERTQRIVQDFGPVAGRTVVHGAQAVGMANDLPAAVAQADANVNWIKGLPIAKASIGLGLATVGFVLLLRRVVSWRVKVCARTFLKVLEKSPVIVRNEQPLADYMLACMHKQVD